MKSWEFSDDVKRFMAQSADAERRLLQRIQEHEAMVVDAMLCKKLGPMTDTERDRARSQCESDVYTHEWGRETRVFHAGEFLVGFSERGFQDELVVSVQAPDGQNELFSANRRDF